MRDRQDNFFTRIDPKYRKRLKVLAAERELTMKELLELLITAEWSKTRRVDDGLQATGTASYTESQAPAQAA